MYDLANRDEAFAFLADRLNHKDFVEFLGKIHGNEGLSGDVPDETPIWELKRFKDCDPQALKVIIWSEVYTVGALAKHTQAEILRLPNIGKKGCQSLRNLLSSVNRDWDNYHYS